VKFSPRIPFNDIEERDAEEVYSYVVGRLNGRGLAYVHVGDFTGEGWHARLRPVYEGVYFAGAGQTKESGEGLVAGGLADAVVYGSKFISNPDLPRRFKLGAPLNEPDQATFYTPGERGYTDYPSLTHPMQTAA
jgi:N-ethylmaleimide reductase